MKKKILISISVLLGLFILTFPLTRYKMNEKPHNVSIPEISQLDTYLEKEESKFKDIVPGAEKKIFWANDKKEQTDYSIAYIHGFSASRPEMMPLPEMIARDLKANIFFTRLSGHGRGSEPFSHVDANDWLNDAVEATEIGQKIGKKVILIGSSTGCTLATWIASQDKYKDSLSSLIFISPNFYPNNKMTNLFLYPAGLAFAKLVYGNERVWQPKNAGIAKYWTHEYKWEAITPMMILVNFVQDIPMSKVVTPSLFLYTEQDKVIDFKEIEKKFQQLGATQKKIKNLSQIPDHVMAGDLFSPESTVIVYQEIREFLIENNLIKK